MLCPRCGANQTGEIKFCTSCGANLQAVRNALDSYNSERPLDTTAEVKRYNEIKAGVIVSSVGIAVAIFLFVFMRGIAGSVSDDEAEVISRLWIAGIIPFMVGMALILNGLIVSKKLVEIEERNKKKAHNLEGGPTPRELRSPDTSSFIPAGMSVTDQTTRHLAPQKSTNSTND